VKNTGICPKCGSSDVHPALHSGTNHILPVESASSSAVYTAHYVCRRCGFVEEWVSEKELPMLRHYFSEK